MPNVETLIELAFVDVNPPGDDDLTVYQKEGRQYDETWKLLRGVNWRSMPVLEFIRGDTPIPDLTPQAFHFYLPALLKASLTDGLSEYVLEPLAFHLNPKYARSDHPECGYDRTAECEAFRSLLSQQQLEAVAATVEQWRDRGWIANEQYAELMQVYGCRRSC